MTETLRVVTEQSHSGELRLTAKAVSEATSRPPGFLTFSSKTLAAIAERLSTDFSLKLVRAEVDRINGAELDDSDEQVVQSLVDAINEGRGESVDKVLVERPDLVIRRIILRDRKGRRMSLSRSGTLALLGADGGRTESQVPSYLEVCREAVLATA